MGEKRLYEVEVTFTYYAQAESVQEAKKHTAQAWDDGGAGETRVRVVEHSDHRLAEDWAPESLVYGADTDVELGDLLEQLPARAS